MNELDHVSGYKVALRQAKSGFYLEGPGGEKASLGDKGPNALLSPTEQEVISDRLGFDASLLGLDLRQDD